MSPLSHDLSPELIDRLGEECAPRVAVAAFVARVAGRSDPDTIESAAQEIFAGYGARLMQRALELGEEYTDQTYEVLKAGAKKTGRLYFPHVAQRFLEVSYLATQAISAVDIVENNHYRMIIRLDPDCVIYTGVGEACGSGVSAQMPCRHVCLTALNTLFDALRLDIGVAQELSMGQDGQCRFVAVNNRPYEGTPWKI
ncbi:MAG: hypothetical protein EPO21_21475 [Chloroflexota bacterium]|nr:MAG: hypothetical protein EPO21_21475 [Chloroflexota bacterium]